MTGIRRRELSFHHWAAVVLLLTLVNYTAMAGAGPEINPLERPLHTYSIVARDAETGQLGVAVQSHWYSVGPVVPWAAAGVGAVATQSLVDISYGPLGLELMRAGRSASQALTALLAADTLAAIRQVAMVDVSGEVAVHTGGRCIAAAGHQSGADYSVQANLMLSDAVWPAMAQAYEASSGDLAERMLVALEAAQAAGGDIRGRQSAAILIVAGESTGRPWVDRLVDLRVEDHPTPLVEMRRLLHLHRAYLEMNRGDELLGEGRTAAALEAYAAAATMVPEVVELPYWQAVTLAGIGRVDEALPIFRQVFAAEPIWAILTPRLVASGLLPDDPELLERILAVAPAER